MALIKIENGDKVLSAPLNDNFEYLDDRITDTNSSLTSAISTMQSSISSATSNLSSEIDTKIAAAGTTTVKTNGNQSIGGNKTFTSVCYGKASSNENSLLTNVKCSVSGSSKNGYVKFGNGMLIQWMSFTQSTNSAPHNWPRTFKTSTGDNNANYVALVGQIKGGSSEQNIAVTSQDYKSITVYAENVERRDGLYAIGIGYCSPNY